MMNGIFKNQYRVAVNKAQLRKLDKNLASQIQNTNTAQLISANNQLRYLPSMCPGITLPAARRKTLLATTELVKTSSPLHSPAWEPCSHSEIFPPNISEVRFQEGKNNNSKHLNLGGKTDQGKCFAHRVQKL